MSQMIPHTGTRDAFSPGKRMTSDTGLALDTLAEAFPVIDATTAHSSRTDKFRVVPTAEVLTMLSEHGYRVTDFIQSRARTQDRRETSRHMFRLRHVDDIGRPRDHVAEIVGVNALDGSSSFRFYGGVIRFVCFNGMVTGNFFGTAHVRHIGNDVLENVFSAVNNIAKCMPDVIENVSRYDAITVDRETTDRMLKKALAIRFTEPQREKMVTMPNLGTIRRNDDERPTLWNVFNRIQENVIKGGPRYVIKDKYGHQRRSSMREVKAVADNVRINSQLWDDVLEKTASELIAA